MASRDAHEIKGLETEGLSVLHCIATLWGGGAEHQLRSLAEPLVRRGMEISIFSRFQLGQAEALAEQGVKCLPIRSAPGDNAALAAEFFRTTRTVRPHILQTWLTQMDLLGGAFPPPGAKRILSERASALAYPPTWKNLARRFVGLRADGVIANSSMGVKYWNRARRVELIPNGVDVAALDAVPRGYYSDSSLLAGRKVAISVGRLCPQKQMQTLIKAADIVRQAVPEFLLVILGEGPDRAELERLVLQRGLGRHVHLAGFVTDAARWMKSAHLCAMGSVFEGQPNAVLEAAAARLPLVLSDIPEHRDLLSDSATYAPPGDDARFAEEIIGVLTSPARHDGQIAAARSIVAARSFEMVADRYAEFYHRLAATNGRSEAGTRKD